MSSLAGEGCGHYDERFDIENPEAPDPGDGVGTQKEPERCTKMWYRADSGSIE